MSTRRIATVATGIAALMCGWLIVLHLRMILSPAPQEMREGAIIWITRLLLERRNPYALAELPASTNAYGIVYRLIVWPFARIFGNGYTVHRAVSGVAIAGSCALMYRLLRRAHADSVMTAVGVMVFYAASVYFVGPLARPDGVAVFFSLASITWLFTDDADPKAFGIGLAFGLLALLTKVYLAFPPFLAALYVMLFVSPKRGVSQLAYVTAATVIALVAMTYFYPAYINLSIVDNFNSAAYYDIDHMQRQTIDWLQYSLPLTVGVIVALARGRAGGGWTRWFTTRPSPFVFGTVANLIVFFAIFAGHPGAHMTYIFQLVTPLLIVALLPALSAQPWPRALVALALPIAFVLNAHYFPLTFGRFRRAETTFAQISSVLRSYENVLGSPEVAGPLALDGQAVYDSGHSQYFGDAAFEWPLPGLVDATALHQRWDDFRSGINRGIVRQRFDLIVRNRRPGLIPSNLVAAHYRRVATFDVEFPWGAQRWPLDVWEPNR